MHYLCANQGTEQRRRARTYRYPNASVSSCCLQPWFQQVRSSIWVLLELRDPLTPCTNPQMRSRRFRTQHTAPHPTFSSRRLDFSLSPYPTIANPAIKLTVSIVPVQSNVNAGRALGGQGKKNWPCHEAMCRPTGVSVSFHLNGWLDEHVSDTCPLVDLQPSGLPLVGGGVLNGPQP